MKIPVIGTPQWEQFMQEVVSRRRYYDKDGTPITLLEWGDRLDRPGYRNVALTQISPTVEVSTVWLGNNYNFFNEGPPLIFETLVFRDGHGDEMDRYSTLAEAVAGHAAMVETIKREIG